MTTWDAAQQARAVGMADWYIWAAKKRIQQACREMEIHRRELTEFEDSFALQLVQLQQHVRDSHRAATREEADLAAVKARIQHRMAICGLVARATQALHSQTQHLMHLLAATEWPTQEFQDPQTN